MFEKYLRPVYQAVFVDRFAFFLSRVSPLSANFITLIGCLFGLFCAFLIAWGSVWFALFFLILSGFCDTLDGTIARLQKHCSAFGTACDLMSDRIVESALVIGLFAYAPQTRGWFCLLLLASILICVTSFLVVGIFSENQSEKNFFYSPGLIERGEAFLFFALMILFPSLFFIINPIFIFLIALTTLIRFVQFANILKNH